MFKVNVTLLFLLFSFIFMKSDVCRNLAKFVCATVLPVDIKIM